MTNYIDFGEYAHALGKRRGPNSSLNRILPDKDINVLARIELAAPELRQQESER